MNIPLPLLFPPPPSGRGRIKVGEGILNFKFWSFEFVWDLGFVICNLNDLLTLKGKCPKIFSRRV